MSPSNTTCFLFIFGNMPAVFFFFLNHAVIPSWNVPKPTWRSKRKYFTRLLLANFHFVTQVLLVFPFPLFFLLERLHSRKSGKCIIPVIYTCGILIFVLTRTCTIRLNWYQKMFRTIIKLRGSSTYVISMFPLMVVGCLLNGCGHQWKPCMFTQRMCIFCCVQIIVSYCPLSLARLPTQVR